jgi:hypothetical protein
MQLCRIIHCSLAALHVSSDIFAQHWVHLNCITASGITHVSCCRLVLWECWYCCMQLCRIIHCSLTALHVSSGVLIIIFINCIWVVTRWHLVTVFRAMFSFIIRSMLTVFTASGIIRICSCLLFIDQPPATYVNNTRSCKYS